jgi:hypothetical protein
MQPHRRVFRKQYPCEASFAGSGVQDTLSGKFAECFQQNAHVEDPRVDRRWKMLLIGRRLFKRTADPLLQIRRQRLGFAAH